MSPSPAQNHHPGQVMNTLVEVEHGRKETSAELVGGFNLHASEVKFWKSHHLSQVMNTLVDVEHGRKATSAELVGGFNLRASGVKFWKQK